MKRLLIFFVVWSVALSALGNMAQPGIFNAGGSLRFQPYYPEDSIHTHKIQMQSEFVSIDLYEGFAVVRGQYFMLNTTDSVVSMKMGYPLRNMRYPENNDIDVHNYGDALTLKGGNHHAFRVLAGTQRLDIDTIFKDSLAIWHTWDMSFSPGEIVPVEVFFVFNTNQGYISMGYTNRSYNSFIYLLESGATWGGVIEQGTVLVRLNGELDQNSLEGYLPEGKLQYNADKELIKYQFTDLKPMPEDNLIITYGAHKEDFDINDILLVAETHYTRVMDLQNMDLEGGTWETLKPKNPYDLGADVGGWMIGAMMLLAIFGIPILVGIVVIVIIVLVVRYYRRRQ